MAQGFGASGLRVLGFSGGFEVFPSSQGLFMSTPGVLTSQRCARGVGGWRQRSWMSCSDVVACSK